MGKYWYFVYWPSRDFLHMLGDHPYEGTFDQVCQKTLSDMGHQYLREENWKSFVIDEIVTEDWREAYGIAARYFGTTNPFVNATS